ncbi:MAG: tetratricopeptide repeat protein [Gemmatimonadales bacterium]
MRPVACLVGLLALNLAAAACSGQEPTSPDGLRARVERLLHRGKADEAVELLNSSTVEGRGAWLGDAHAARGRVAEAEAAFRAVAAAPGAYRLYAEARLAELARARGDRENALTLARRIDDAIDLDGDLGPADWLAFGIVSELIGPTQPARFKDALGAFDRAIARDSTWLEPQLRVGDLFLSKYNAPDAEASYRGVLARDADDPRALLGLARVAEFNGDPRAIELAWKALAAGPDVAAAHALLGRLDLDVERYDSALVRADRALALDSTLLEAWGLRGAVQEVTDDTVGYRSTERMVEARNRSPALFYSTIAEALGRQRRYREAAAFGARARAVAPDDTEALTVLGTNELRTGAIDSGRARLERAFERDPYHVWNKNTLDLLDELGRYTTIRSGRIELVAPPDEAELLALYLVPLLERGYDSLAARYRYRPPTPIRLELYKRHADFSVRTVGLAGLGALGVSFGRVLAMDAPSAREKGEMNFGSTAWHELAHTFTLGASGHRVPRWLSEGLSVLEERRARPGWGAEASVAFLSAFKGGLLPKVSQLNDGFVRPKFAGQIGLSYYLSSLVCEYLEATRGFDAVVGMLTEYRAGASTAEVIRRVLKTEPATLDREFEDWIRERFAKPLSMVGVAQDTTLNPGELGALLANAERLRAAGRVDEAIAMLERVREAFPDQGDHASAAWLLSRIYQERADTTKWLTMLAEVTRYNDSHLAANLAEGELRMRRDDHAGAFDAYERAIYIDPYDQAPHEHLAEMAERLGRHAVSVRERQAVLALGSADRAEAGYQLARAYRLAGDLAAARREILKVLEAAPSFERAQALLLELTERP